MEVGAVLTLAIAALLATGPAVSSRPMVTGALQQGAKLTGTTGTWAGAGDVAYRYQWSRCDTNGARCSSIRGATRATYTLVAKDVGATIGLTVRAADNGGTTAAFAPLAGLIAASAGAARQPALGGDPVVGRALSTAAPSSWKRCNENGRACSTVAGATGAEYTLEANDAGHQLVAVSGGVWSIASAVVRAAPGPVPVAAPAVSGTLRQGEQLRAAAGAWSGAGNVAYAYQWYRCAGNGAHCSSIHGATKATYTLVAKDAGAAIGLTVRATDSTGTTAAYAPLAGLIASAASTLAATTQPTLARSNGLKVVPGEWSRRPTAFTYAWLRCNANGRLCTAIVGAAADAYTPGAADRGHALVAAVTATAGTASQTVLTVAAAPL